MFAMSRLMTVLMIGAVLFTGTACKKKFNTQDVDPGKAGRVRALGPESQDAIRIADQMTRALLADEHIAGAEFPPTIAMLPVDNNTRFAFNKDIFAERLKAELNKRANGAMRFISRDIMEDIQAERDAKRDGMVDYDPEKRTATVAGADYFLKGKVDGLSTASGEGNAEYSLYTFKLVDTETGLELWEDFYEVKREGRDDVVYR